MTEFISFTLSTFGTWFGISVLALNPFGCGHGNKKSKIKEEIVSTTMFALTLNKLNVNQEAKDITVLCERVERIEKYFNSSQTNDTLQNDNKLFHSREQLLT